MVVEVSNVAETGYKVAEVIAAFAGVTVANKPNPNADTVTSATRLMIVFVDIDFLSVVDLMTFTRSAWVEIFPPA